MDYKNYLQTNHWKNLRMRILIRDKFKCTICGNKKNLQVHHLTYNNIGNENTNDLITLCKMCHLKIHNKQQYSIDYKCSLLYPVFNKIIQQFLKNYINNILDTNFLFNIKNYMDEITFYIQRNIVSQWEYYDTEDFILKCFYKYNTRNGKKLGKIIMLYHEDINLFNKYYCNCCKMALYTMIMTKLKYIFAKKRNNNFIIENYDKLQLNDYSIELIEDNMLKYSYYKNLSKNLKLSEKENIFYLEILKCFFIDNIYDNKCLKKEIMNRLNINDLYYRKLLFNLRNRYNKYKHNILC